MHRMVWNKKIIWLVALAVLMSDRLGMAQTPAVPDSTVEMLEERVELFLEDLSEEDATSVVSSLLRGSPLLEESEKLNALIVKIQELEPTFGPQRGHEPIFSKRVGNDLVLLKYLNKHEKHPVVWHLAFYRDFNAMNVTDEAGAWRVISLRFDTDLEALLKLEQAK